MLKSYRHTFVAASFGYVTQAIVNNFLSLLFLTFAGEFSLALDQITLLITVNFAIQLVVDLIASKYVDKIGYRPCMVAGQSFIVVGLTGLAWLPDLMPSPLLGLLVCVFFNAIGGGLLEVLVSPIVEACPFKNKSSMMGLLHSFYCWGVVAVVLISTLLFSTVGIAYWRLFALFWAIVPLLNAVYFCFVPILPLVKEGDGMRASQLFRSGTFWIFLALMITGGAAEVSMAQWASAFAESGLGVSKTVGDILGPCTFALMMGLTRTLFAKFGKKIKLTWALGASAALCIVAYLLACLSPIPALSLVGCALCGVSVALLWPGIFSLASERTPMGGTVMFSLLALAGDVGCMFGPSLVGWTADAMGGNLKMGMLVAIIFPALLILCLFLLKIIGKRKSKKTE